MKTKSLLNVLFLALLIGTFSVAQLHAQEFTVGDLKYSINDDGISVTLIGPATGSSYSGELNLPESVTYEGLSLTVTSIGNAAFYMCTGLTGDLILPNTVTTIGWEAFWCCYGLTGNLIIPNSVTTIGWEAFGGCIGLTSLYIPNSVTSIGSGAFAGWYGLTSIIVDSDNPVYDSRNNCNAIIKTEDNELISGCNRTIIPDNIVSIGDHAFEWGIVETRPLIIPNSVTSIGHWAFYGCSGLTGDLNIPNSVTSIGEQAFYGCSGFDGILTLPNSITEIGPETFRDCSSFTGGLNIPNSVTSIGNNAFAGCSGFNGTLTLPYSLTEIGACSFYECSGLSGDLIIPNSITEINGFTFYSTGFTSVKIPNSITFFGCGAFANCPNLTHLEYNAINCTVEKPYNNGSSYNYSYSFTAIKSLIIGNNVQNIPRFLFEYCQLDTIIVLATTPPTLGTSAFTHYSVADNANLIVPCGSISDYENSAWNNNYLWTISEDCTPRTITINPNISDGTITASTNTATMGQTVTLHINPDPGHDILSITVHNINNPNQTVDVINNTFAMPPYDVYVDAVFGWYSVNENDKIITSIYPNPTSGIVRIEAENIRNISIYNVLGELLYNSPVSGDVFEYDFSNYESGVYLVRIETSKGIITKRVMVEG